VIWPRFLQVFRLPSFRFQWGSDLLVSWAFEMEVLLLGWFVLVATDSPLMVAVMGALHYGGTLLCPWFGVLADRMDRRNVLIVMRISYGGFAATIMVLALSGHVAPWQLLVIAGLSIRTALVADIVPSGELQNALGLSRITMDLARIVGALLGAGLFSAIGLGAAYGAVVGLYAISALLARGITVRRTGPPSAVNQWAELMAGFRYLREDDRIVACLLLAFLVNLTGFSITHGLLPVIARDVYDLDANGFARLSATLALGALAGSVLVATVMRSTRPGPIMITTLLAWHVLVGVLALTTSALAGAMVVLLIGAAQSMSMITMSTLLLTICEARYRGRVSGVRMLMIYGLPLGLVLAGWLVETTGMAMTLGLYSLIGMSGTVLVIARWPRVFLA